MAHGVMNGRFVLPSRGGLASPDNSVDLGESPAHSEVNDVIVRRHLLQDDWKDVFAKFDAEGEGEVSALNFLKKMLLPEFQSLLDTPRRLRLIELVRSGQLASVTYQEFVSVMSGKRSHSYLCAVHQRDHRVKNYAEFHNNQNPQTCIQSVARMVAKQCISDDRERKYYADRYRCWPPPLFIPAISCLELGFFIYYWCSNVGTSGRSLLSGDTSGLVPEDSVFIYRPDMRWQIWRFLTYILLHSSWWHLGFNVLVQLAVGLPLEMVHGSARIVGVYFAGVLAGSLATSVFDSGRHVCLVGASGGVYSLLAAHIANVLLNFHNMEFGVLRVFLALLMAGLDLGLAIYNRYTIDAPLINPAVSYLAHLAGSLAGISLGLVVLKNFQQRLRERIFWWVALGFYATCTLVAIFYNVLQSS